MVAPYATVQEPRREIGTAIFIPVTNAIEALNSKLAEAGEPWRYHFVFLSPEDYTRFFEQIRNTSYAGWRSGLMQDLEA